MWWLSPQTMNDCAHAAGHGYFYYFLDIGRAVLACTDPTLANYAPGTEYSLDTDDHLGDPYESLLRASSGYQPSTKVPKLNVALQQVRARATASRHAPAA